MNAFLARWKLAIIAGVKDTLAVVGFIMLTSFLVRQLVSGVHFLALSAGQAVVIAAAWRWSTGKWFWQPTRIPSPDPESQL